MELETYISEITRIVEIPLPPPFGGAKKLYSKISVLFPFCDSVELAQQAASELDKPKFENIANSILDILEHSSMLELNDDFTRKKIFSIMDEYCYANQQELGIYDFRPVCDERNNPPKIIDENKLYADLYLQFKLLPATVRIFSSVGPEEHQPNGIEHANQ